jgi:putative Holliday junction resolvase
MSEAIPTVGRLAGIDYGTVRIGVAISDPGQILASPLGMRQRGGNVDDARYFRQLVQDEALVGFVIGLPVHTDGQESRKSAEARAFGQWLAEQTGVPVAFYDERYSTKFAERSLLDAELTRKKRKQRRDMIAAQVILAAYLESSRSDGAEDLESDRP